LANKTTSWWPISTYAKLIHQLTGNPKVGNWLQTSCQLVHLMEIGHYGYRTTSPSSMWVHWQWYKETYIGFCSVARNRSNSTDPDANSYNL